MTEFEKILEQCLIDLEMGIANIDECLSRYPGHALQLRPVLLTHTSLEHAGEMQPSPAFKARVRAKLTQQMQAHPRKSRGLNFAFMRFAVNLAIILLALLTVGTAYAQGALPGEPFYEWKLVSENAWRAVSSDPVETDLAIAERRKSELIAVSHDPALQAQALEAYLEVAARLMSEMNVENEALILQTLDSQAEDLEESGISVPQIINEEVPPQIDEILPTLVNPIETLLPVTEIPQVNPTLPASTPSAPEVIPPLLTELPPVNSTDLPESIPTVEVPTIQVSQILPTIKVSTLLP